MLCHAVETRPQFSRKYFNFRVQHLHQEFKSNKLYIIRINFYNLIVCYDKFFQLSNQLVSNDYK